VNSQQIYEELKDVAEKLGITVSEQSFKQTAIRVKSGLCTVRGKRIYIMDKHASINKKTGLLVDCLSQMPHEEIYVIPAVREMLMAESSKNIQNNLDPLKS